MLEPYQKYLKGYGYEKLLYLASKDVHIISDEEEMWMTGHSPLKRYK